MSKATDFSHQVPLKAKAAPLARSPGLCAPFPWLALPFPPLPAIKIHPSPTRARPEGRKVTGTTALGNWRKETRTLTWSGVRPLSSPHSPRLWPTLAMGIRAQPLGPAHSHRPLLIPIEKYPPSCPTELGRDRAWAGSKRQGKKRRKGRGLEKSKLAASTPALGPQYLLLALREGGTIDRVLGPTPWQLSFIVLSSPMGRLKLAEVTGFSHDLSAEVALSPPTAVRRPQKSVIPSTAGLPHCPPRTWAQSAGLPEPVGGSQKGLER